MRQHYVPRLYLKHFSVEKNNEYMVYVYDKHNKKYFQTNIKNVAAEKDLYTINNSNGLKIVDDENVWEHYYSNTIEPEFSRVLKDLLSLCDIRIINDRSIVLNDEIRLRLAIQIIYQIYRGKTALIEADKKRDSLYGDIKNQAEELAKEFYGESNTINVDYYLKNDDLWKASFANASISGNYHLEFINKLMNRSWLVNKIISDKFFVTSDNPVLLYDMNSEKVGLFQAGLGYNSTVLCFPISSKLMITMYSNDIMFGQFNEMKNQIYFLSDNDNEFIDRINELQLEQCIRQVYSQYYYCNRTD